MSYGQNYNIFDDVHQLEKMVGAFRGYLKGSELYGSVTGGFLMGNSGMPSITVGAIQMRVRRLNVLYNQLDTKRQGQVHQSVQQYERIAHELEDAYQDKVLHEVNSRLDAMTTFFEECRQEPKTCPRIYQPEVLRRTIVQELVTLMDERRWESEELTVKLRKTDKRLRGYLQESDFVWDKQLESVYPKADFWWMWMAPQAV
jgi:hypothetical protein